MTWTDIVLLAVGYVVTGVGVTVGYHRLFTHRAFQTSRPFRTVVAVLGSMAVEGSVITWVADHRKHHAFPTSAFHGLRFWERIADPTGLVIALCEKLGLVWDVVRVSPDRQAAKALPSTRRDKTVPAS